MTTEQLLAPNGPWRAVDTCAYDDAPAMLERAGLMAQAKRFARERSVVYEDCPFGVRGIESFIGYTAARARDEERNRMGERYWYHHHVCAARPRPKWPCGHFECQDHPAEPISDFAYYAVIEFCAIGYVTISGERYELIRPEDGGVRARRIGKRARAEWYALDDDDEEDG